MPDVSCIRGLHKLLALLGAIQDSFAQAVPLKRLCPASVYPESMRTAMEVLDATLTDHNRRIVTTALTMNASPPEQSAAPRISV